MHLCPPFRLWGPRRTQPPEALPNSCPAIALLPKLLSPGEVVQICARLEMPAPKSVLQPCGAGQNGPGPLTELGTAAKIIILQSGVLLLPPLIKIAPYGVPQGPKF